MQDQWLAVHRTIVVVDVEGFGDQRRTNRDQVAIRDGLYRAMQDAFGRAGILWDDCGHEDRGDGVFVLVPAEVPKGLLAEALPPALATALREHNDAHSTAGQIRLRMALHAGEVHYDEHGVTATAVNLAFRLLDAGVLKVALASSPGVLAVMASSWFYEEVLRHSAAASAYCPVEVAVKETSTTGWISLPDHADPAGWATSRRLHAVAAVPGALPPVVLRTLPRDTAAFTGRTGELDRLAAAVRETAAGGLASIQAIDGMAGVGKTAFAVHAAHQLAARFPDGQVFLRLHAHTSGQQPVDPADALATLLLSIGVAPQQIPPGLEARSACWRGHLADKKVLLVLDDAAGSGQVRPLLPGSASCLVLVTSQRRLTALEEAVPVSLGTLPPDEAAALFLRLAGRSDLQAADAAVAEVTGLCGWLPLAIRLAATGLRHHPVRTLTDLAVELTTARDRLAALQAEEVSVAAAFDLSYQDLTADQQSLFRQLGLHPGTDFDGYAAAALGDTDLRTARRRLDELYDHNLISEPTRGRYRLHDLLREYVQNRVAGGDAVDNRDAISRLLDYYLHTAVAASRHTAWRHPVSGPPPPSPEPVSAPDMHPEEEAIAWLTAERANLYACVSYGSARGHLAHAIQIAVAISGFLHIQGHWNEAATLDRIALAAARTAADRPGQARALTQLGIVQELTGDYPAATASLAQALQLFSDLGDRQGQACALHDLGVVQRRTGDCIAAAASLTQALQLSRALGDRRGRAWALRDLGVVQRRTGDYPAATASLTQALQLFSDPGDRRGRAWALHDLGVVQQLTGDYPAATASLTQALQLFSDLGDRRGSAWALHHLGVVQQLTGDYPAATASLTQALQLFSDLGDRQGHAWALDHLGMVQQLTGDYPAATASLTQALQLFSNLGDRYGQADTSIHLGELLLLSTTHREARDYFDQALIIARDINMPVEEARALEGIGRCHIQEGDPRQGDANLQQALKIYRRIDTAER